MKSRGAKSQRREEKRIEANKRKKKIREEKGPEERRCKHVKRQRKGESLCFQ